jgi:beta-glucosidase
MIRTKNKQISILLTLCVFGFEPAAVGEMSPRSEKTDNLSQHGQGGGVYDQSRAHQSGRDERHSGHHDPTLSDRERFVESLLKQMTLTEKIGQLSQISADPTPSGAPGVKRNDLEELRKGHVGSVLNATPPELIEKMQAAARESRLKIPVLFGLDVIHGYRIIFPIPLGEAASWDFPRMEATAHAAAREASLAGQHWTFAPMVDISRDPRWGRVMEGAGEDPWLGSRIAEARVRGFQGRHLSDPDSLLACVKHFAAYGAPLGGRDYNTVDLHRRELLQTYLPPYRAAINAGAATVMTAFNDVEGVPSSSNKWLLMDILKNDWGFKGFVVSDWHSIEEILAHGTAGSPTEAAMQAFKAGLDMDMDSDFYKNNLPKLVQSGQVSEQQIDDSVRRVLRMKYDKGLFQPALRIPASVEKHPVLQDNRSLARDMARRSMVLLKNDGNVLPLSKTAKIALVGPLAKDNRHMLGAWAALGKWQESVGVMDGFNKAVKDKSQIRFAKGANLLEPGPLLDYLNKHYGEIQMDRRSPQVMIEEAKKVAADADVVVVALGEARNMYGEAASRSEIRIPKVQRDLLKAMKSTGKKVVLLVFNGRPLVLTEEAELADAILIAWAPGSEGGNAVADVVFGEWNPSGKLPMSFPRNEGQIPIFYGHKSTGRPLDLENWFTSRYLDVSNEPLYRFGYGLSYTQFKYEDLKLSSTNAKLGQKIRASVNVINAGDRAGEETVQLYIRDVVASATRPVLELRGAKKVWLRPGEKKRVEFELADDDLKFWDAELKWVSEPGEFKVFVGGNSADLLASSFQLIE